MLQASTAKQVIDQGKTDGTVAATNHPPVAVPDNFGIDEDDAFNVPTTHTLQLGNVFSTDTDADNDPIHGTGCSANPTLSNNLPAAFAGLTVTANDVSMTDASGCTFTLALGPSSAIVTVALDGGVSLQDPLHLFDPLGAGESIVLTSGYTIADNFGASATATFNVTVNGVAA